VETRSGGGFGQRDSKEEYNFILNFYQITVNISLSGNNYKNITFSSLDQIKPSRLYKLIKNYHLFSTGELVAFHRRKTQQS
jgi:hypothetical protein